MTNFINEEICKTCAIHDYNVNPIKRSELEIYHKWSTDDYTVSPKKSKFYCLAMFPYTSGELHMGHARTYIISDFIARFQILKGKNVLHPIGWDSFGLPAENAAQKNNLDPADWTKGNISSMKAELKTWGCCFNWDKELSTSCPTYYKHTQWLFLKMWEMGLVYRKNSYVYWDPKDKTVLANEQVIKGRGWRSNALVEKRSIPQWYIKVTAYQKELYEKLNTLVENWPANLIHIQQNWIGESKGYHVSYELVSNNLTSIKHLTAFTTDLNSVKHGTYILISPSHQLSKHLANNYSHVKNWITENIQIASKHNDKDSVLNTELYAINPSNQNKMKVFISNTVEDYATGVVQCCPKVSDKDREFALRHNLPLEFTNERLDDFKYQDAVYYKLKDWCVSRQRKWGTPIPLLTCNECGVVPVSYSALPIVHSTREALCSICNNKGQVVGETLDTFFDSCWYYLRYINPNSSESIPKEVDYMLPVDYYIGGIEHATLHLLYARFAYKVIRDLGYVVSDEPFAKIINQGMITKNGAKMSKSKGNIVRPSEIISKYGVDCMRFFILAAAPPKQTLEWDDKAILGSYRFINRCYTYLETFNKTVQTKDNISSYSQTDDYTGLSSVFIDEVNSIYNYVDQTCINNVASSCIKLLYQLKEMSGEEQIVCTSIFLRLLNPICPHVTDYFWRKIGFGNNILLSNYPKVNRKRYEHVVIKVLHNEKVVGSVSCLSDSSEDEVIISIREHKLLPKVSYKKRLYILNKIFKFIL